MANPWKNIIDKLSARKHTMRESDWAAMQEKIEAHPELQQQAGSKRGAYFAGAFILAGIVATAIFWPSGNEKPSKSEIPVQHSPDNTPAAPTHNIYTSDSSFRNRTEKPGPNFRSTTKTDLTKNSTGETAKPAKTRPHVAIIPTYRKPALSIEFGKVGAERSISALYRQPIHTQPQDSKKRTNLTQGVNEEKAETSSIALSSDEEKSSAVNPSSNKMESDSAGGEPELLLRADSLLNLQPKTAPEEAAPAPFVSPGTDIEIYSLQWTSGYSSQFRPRGWQQWQTGADFYFQRNNLMLNTGIYFGERWFNRDDSYTQRSTSVDSTWIRNIETRNELQITKIWVIDSFFAGHYELDTSIVQVTDTTYGLRIDTTKVITDITEETRIAESFVAIPLTVGYRYNFGRWDVMGNVGAVFRQVTTASPERTNRQSNFGADLLLRPELRYRIGSHWDIFTRLSMRYPVVQNSELPQKSPSYGGQIGVAVRFGQQ